MVITHRGRHTNKQENTIASFDKALSLGAQAIECDLRLTLDNQVMVYHDKKIMMNNKKVAISNILFKDLRGLLVLDELFMYIEKRNVPFFLEVKSSSRILAESIIKEIVKRNLWSQVNIIGFSFFIGTAVRLQSKYPKLKVWQLVNIPLYSYLRKPSKSYGIMLGWFDEFFGSEWLFRKLIPIERLSRLREFYEKNGFKVIGAVVNRESGFKYFEQAGITDIVTDNVSLAVNYFNEKKV